MSASGAKSITRMGGRWIITFPYHPNTVAGVKTIPGARWDAENRFWWVGCGPNDTNVAQFGAEWGFGMPEELAELAGRLVNERWHVEQPMDGPDVPGLLRPLFPFQRGGVAYAREKRRTFIADEMGTGKTQQALATLYAENAWPAVVMCPTSLKYNWKAEAEKTIPGVNCCIIEGGKTHALPRILSRLLVIVNYDVAAKWKDELIYLKPKALVLDESHMVKSGKTLRTKAIRKLADAVMKDRGGEALILLLTGTPVMNRPSELVNQLRVMHRINEFGGWQGFVERYCLGEKNRFGWSVKGASHLPELNYRLRQTCMIRRTKDEVLKDLPPKMRTSVPIHCASLAAYREAEDRARQWATAHVHDLLSGHMKLPTIQEIAELRRQTALAKLPGVIEWVEEFLESGEKLVLFAHHREVQEDLRKRFKDCAYISADLSPQERAQQVERFQQDEDCQLIVCSIMAAGVGLTLTAASNVAFAELAWNPATLDQCEDRCHRISATRPVTAHYLLADETIDMPMASLIESKRVTTAAVTDGKIEADRSGSIVEALIAILIGEEALEKAQKVLTASA